MEYKGFLYQVASWKMARGVVAKVEHHARELLPHVGFIVTNLTLPSRGWCGSTTSAAPPQRRSRGEAIPETVTVSAKQQTNLDLSTSERVTFGQSPHTLEDFTWLLQNKAIRLSISSGF